MIFEFAEVKAIVGILKLVSIKKSKYGEMFRETKVSHTTLQSVLKELEEKNIIEKQNIGHQKVDYLITRKGKKLLGCLIEIKQLLN